MKPRFVLLGLCGVLGCSFPNYDIESLPMAGAAGQMSVAEPTCDDGKRNGDETGIDCGIAACSKACPAGQGCGSDSDCDGGLCADKLCRAASCQDGLTNGTESDQDCGGTEGCARCTVDQRCTEVADCDGGLCTSGSCKAPTCKDGLQNAAETDIDCGGGTCAACGVDQGCQTNDDCDGLLCSKGKCQPASCSDGVLNQDETDLDCGGGCDACDDGLKCLVAGDCTSGVCPSNTRTCAEPTCKDGVKNGDEPTEDCGATCPNQCELLDACALDGDCKTGSCVRDLCLPESSTGAKLSTAGWSATASNTFGNSSPQNAIDGVAGTDWTTGIMQVPGLWFQIDMQKTQVFFSIEIDCTNTRDDSAAAVDIWFSEDGSFTEPAKSNFDGGDNMVIAFEEPQVARYIKISLAEGTDHWWRMDEIRVKQ